MIAYTLLSSVCWSVFLLFYILVLRKETFYGANRFYLLGTLLVSLVLPLGYFFQSMIAVPEPMISYTLPLNEVIVSLENAEVPQSLWSWSYLWYVYYIGIGVATMKFAVGLVQIRAFHVSGIKQMKDGITYVYNDRKHLPFSFFKRIYLSRNYTIKGDLEQIIRHEMVHIRQWHSLDVMVVEILQIVFWFNPLLKWYKQAIKENHEYIADADVVENKNIEAYCSLLLNHICTPYRMTITNQFFQKQIKNRIMMMKMKQSQRVRRLKYVAVVPMVLLLSMFILACNQEDTTTQVAVEQEEKIYKTADELPRFPGCEDEIGDVESKEQCAQNKLLQYIYSNLKYPTDARDKGIEGMSVVQFVVDTNGKLLDIHNVRSIGGGCDEEVVRVIKNMNSMPDHWTPGKNNGKPVKVMFTLPVRFKLKG